MRKKVLMVLTSSGRRGGSGDRTGLWLEEFAGPYYLFMDAKAEVTVTSPGGGHAPIDPESERPGIETDAIRRFKYDSTALAHLTRTRLLSDIDSELYDAVFYPGGHGALWDLAGDPHSRRLIETMYAESKPVAAVGHGVAVFREARGPFGLPLVRGKQVTGFSNSEEASTGLEDVVPFRIEDMLREHGGEYSRAPDWQPHVVVTETLITGQNPASAADAARAVLKMLA